MDEKKYLRLGQKLGYGLGDFGGNFSYTFVSSFVLLYLTNTIGLNSGVVGTLMLISKLLDGISDVVFGGLIDRTKSRMGKARPWMLWSGIPLALTVILQFTIPVSMSTVLQYAWFFVVYTLMNAVCYTANNISYSTLSALITKNNNERIQLGAFRYIFALIAAILISSVTVSFVDVFGGGVTGWRTVAIIYALILLAFNTLAALCVKELPNEGAAGDNEVASGSSSLKDIFNNLKYLAENRYFWLILLIYLAINLMSGISNSVGAYFTMYNLGDASLLGIFSLAGMFPMMLGILITPLIAKKLGMYKTVLYSMILCTLVSIPYLIVGWREMLVPMIVFLVIRGIFMGPITCSMTAIVAESARYSYLKNGVNIEGTMFSCSSIGVKLGSGIGTAICGWALELAKFDGSASVQSDTTLSIIRFMFVVFPVIIIVLQTILAAGLNVERANAKLEEKVR